MNFFDSGEIIDNDTNFVFFGIPWDDLTSIVKLNSSKSPQKIRKITENLALTTEMEFEIAKLKFVDAGDVLINSNDTERNILEIDDFVKSLFDQKKDIIPVMVGGDHFCTYPVIKAIGDSIRNPKKFGVLILDAHLDLYEKYQENIYSHATVSHLIHSLDFISNKNLLIIGTRDIDVPELKIAKTNDITYFNSYVLHDIGVNSFTDKIIQFFEKSDIKDLYISIDIDALDPSIAPGTGYAIPGGFTYREVWKILRGNVKCSSKNNNRINVLYLK
ncbi:MAG: arginase family protein [Promethearchaeota archaeon]